MAHCADIYLRSCPPQAMTCLHSSDATAATWTRSPLPTDRCLSTLYEWRKGEPRQCSHHFSLNPTDFVNTPNLAATCLFSYASLVSIKGSHLLQGFLPAKCAVLLSVAMQKFKRNRNKKKQKQKNCLTGTGKQWEYRWDTDAAGTDTCSVLWQVAGGLEVCICFTLNERLTFCAVSSVAELKGRWGPWR